MAQQRFTQYYLTNDQLQRLSAICNDRPHRAGMPLLSLENKGLIEERENAIKDYSYPGGYYFTHKPTAEGRKALELARKLGW